MACVFITQEPWPDRDTGQPTKDFTPAQKYGELVFLLPHDYLPDEHVFEDLRAAGLNRYRVGDYLVLAGHPATIGAAVALCSLAGPVNVLIWSGRRRAYDRITLPSPEEATT